MATITAILRIHRLIRRHKGAMMGARRIRREQRRVDMAQSRRRNGVRKSEERTRRDKRMREILKKSKPPYAPFVMSWLSAQLCKPSTQVTAEDVKKLIA